MNLFFHREFHFIILKLIHNNLLQNCEMELQNNRIVKYEGWGVLDSIELRMLRRVDYLPAHSPLNISTYRVK